MSARRDESPVGGARRKNQAHHHAELLAGVANQGSFKPTSELLAGLEGKRILKLPEVGRLNGISVDTIRRKYSHLIVRMSDGRIGMRLEDALSIAQPLDAA
jgi:hypothetical protein